VVVLPAEKSALTETSLILLKGVTPRLRNYDLTFSWSQVSVPAGLGLSIW